MISITIPIYNEQDCIEELYQSITKVMQELKENYEIILVNDGSIDNSHSIIEKVRENDPHVKGIHLKRNYGQTAAMMAGFDHSTGDIIIPLDGDLQNDPNDIPRLIAKMNEGFDLVSGWRKHRYDNKITRTLPSTIANRLISFFSGVKLHDYGCTLKAYRREIIKDIKLYGEMHRFIPIYARWEGAKITEITVEHHPRTHGRSNYGANRIIKVFLDLLVVQFLFHFSKKPIYLFGSFGLALIFSSFLVISYALFKKFIMGLSLILTPLPVLSAMLFITGVTSILMGLLAELVTRTYHETQNKPVYSINHKSNFN